MAPRPKKQPNPETYSGRVAIRLRQLRETRGWSVAELQDRLQAASEAIEGKGKGKKIPASTIYAYELGKKANGVDVPLEVIPLYSAAFGFKTANGVLPTE